MMCEHASVSAHALIRQGRSLRFERVLGGERVAPRPNLASGSQCPIERKVAQNRSPSWQIYKACANNGRDA
eukprot:6208311-Pleurochrysis_carterae.AAC.3